ncbi:MAG: DNA-binding response regulator [Bacteroidales bacterium]|nr:DNA-binding response regulator [Bacteroidales bacterium]
MVKISCIVIEDEPPALEKLVGFIERTPWLQLKATFSNSVLALEYMQTNNTDLLFLDIQMEMLTGLQLLDSLPTKPHVIFTTAYSEYALKGYEYNIVDYLLKPYSFDRFLKAVQKLQPLFGANQNAGISDSYIFLKTDYKIVKVENSEILYIEGMRDYRCVSTAKSKILTQTTFTELCSLLPVNMFVRVHKSWVVSISKITSIEHHRIYIADKIIPIGDTYKEAFYQHISQK